MLVETEGIILHSLNYSDSSKIVTVYSSEFGKIKLIAKGARGNQKKFGSSLEILSISKIIFYKKEDRDLYLISKSELVTPSTKLQNNFEQLSYALAIVEIVNSVFKDEDKNYETYNLLKDTLNYLSKEKLNFLNIYLIFLTKLFKLLGFEISYKNCIICKRSLIDFDFEVFSNITKGTLYCKGCHNKTKHGEVKLSNKSYKDLVSILSCEMKNLREIIIAKESEIELKNFLTRYGEFYLSNIKSLKSLKLLENFNRTQKELQNEKLL